MARTGRRRGESGTREAILDAARACFAERGFSTTSVRSIAAAAGVDPALVHHYFGTKGELFAAAMELPLDPGAAVPALLEPGIDGLGERLVRFFLGVWDEPAARQRVQAVLRSALTEEAAAALLRDFVTTQVLGRVAAALGTPDGELRASLVGSQLVGLGLLRYLVRVEPLASADEDTVVAAVAPTIQRYLTGDMHQPG
ncbi:TetR family transcriptional regulator [Solirubrobacter sp. CPCC 204708]|uniref:TetR family transcriptional regulator n=1 Tax=Solirubrobacter deserti TaxID=2282478 RepID=A0ABT4RGW9_9ACTN|nr:TetR family transcriptional regulator [Solirubrobacter deserti]MBE2315394.1 TetR family transcriptional regulator [Solirubrobacter deserti]MDA0137762.1 TetR family transcriptional regulator [Solirubrobacter deserti]